MENTQKQMINIHRLRKILPKSLGKEYENSYLEKIKHLNIPQTLKSLKKFQDNSGFSSFTIPENFKPT